MHHNNNSNVIKQMISVLRKRLLTVICLSILLLSTACAQEPTDATSIGEWQFLGLPNNLYPLRNSDELRQVCLHMKLEMNDIAGATPLQYNLVVFLPSGSYVEIIFSYADSHYSFKASSEPAISLLGPPSFLFYPAGDQANFNISRTRVEKVILKQNDKEKIVGEYRNHYSIEEISWPRSGGFYNISIADTKSHKRELMFLARRAVE